jgi:hypothetical protein
MRHRRAVVILALGLTVACLGDRAELGASANGVSRSRKSDTVVVYTTGDGVWGPAHDATELLRVPGGTKETTFGSVSMLAATPDGGVLVLDSKAAEGMIVRQFDANGAFVRNIGGRGTGPGEYSQTGQVTITVHPNGTILIRDGRRAVNRYTAQGKLLNSFALGLANAGSLDIVAAIDGTIYVRGPFLPAGAPGAERMPSMLRFDTAGRLLDSVVDGRPWLPPVKAATQFTARQAWNVLPDKRVYFGRSDKLGFLVVDPAGNSPPLIGELRAAPVPFSNEERAELEEIEAWRQRTYPPEARGALVTVPESKLPMRGALADIDGRIWIFKSAPGQKAAPRYLTSGTDSVKFSFDEPRVLAAFQTDGTFLGELRFPMGLIPTFVGNTAWAIVTDGHDAPTLVKYQLHF